MFNCLRCVCFAEQGVIGAMAKRTMLTAVF